jgi:hypothetical protein
MRSCRWWVFIFFVVLSFTQKLSAQVHLEWSAMLTNNYFFSDPPPDIYGYELTTAAIGASDETLLAGQAFSLAKFTNVVFLARYDAHGVHQWTYNVESDPAYSSVDSIAPDPKGDYYISARLHPYSPLKTTSLIKIMLLERRFGAGKLGLPRCIECLSMMLNWTGKGMFIIS